MNLIGLFSSRKVSAICLASSLYYPIEKETTI